MNWLRSRPIVYAAAGAVLTQGGRVEERLVKNQGHVLAAFLICLHGPLLLGCEAFDDGAFVSIHFGFGHGPQALMPGTTGFLSLEDSCPATEWIGCSSTENIDQVVEARVVDSSVVDKAPWDAIWGTELYSFRFYPIRALAPGMSVVQLAGQFDDETTRMASENIVVADAETIIVDTTRGHFEDDCSLGNPRLWPGEGPGLLRRVFVGEEIALSVGVWGKDENGRDVSVGGRVDVPILVEGLGVAHTIQRKALEDWLPSRLEYSIMIHETGDVVVDSALPGVSSNLMVVRGVSASDVVSFDLGAAPPSGYLHVGDTRFFTPRPRDDSGIVCGSASFLDRMRIASESPSICLLSIRDGQVDEEVHVDAEVPGIRRGFYVHALASGRCRVRLQLPDMVSWDEHEFEVRVRDSSSD